MGEPAVAVFAPESRPGHAGAITKQLERIDRVFTRWGYLWSRRTNRWEWYYQEHLKLLGDIDAQLPEEIASPLEEWLAQEKDHPYRYRPAQLRRFVLATMRKHKIGLARDENPHPAVPTPDLAKLPWFTTDATQFPIPILYGIDRLVSEFSELVNQGNDVFFVVDSPLNVYPYGRGKSSLMQEILMAYAVVSGRQFDPRTNIVWVDDGVQFDHLRQNPKPIVWGTDELRNFLDRRFAMSADSKRRLQGFAMTRKLHHVAGGCADNIYRLDSGVSLKATHLLRISEYRSVADVYRKGPMDEANDKWGIQPAAYRVKWAALPEHVEAVGRRCIAYHQQHYSAEMEYSPIVQAVQENARAFLDDPLVDVGIAANPRAVVPTSGGRR